MNSYSNKSKIKHLSKREKLGELLRISESPILVFLEDKFLEDFLGFEAILDGKEIILVMPNTFSDELLSERINSMIVLKGGSVDLVDRLKELSEDRGFSPILVLDSNPVSVRQALGAARILGEVHLFETPEGEVVVDLHSTVNYKSLKIFGHHGEDKLVQSPILG